MAVERKRQGGGSVEERRKTTCCAVAPGEKEGGIGYTRWRWK